MTGQGPRHHALVTLEKDQMCTVCPALPSAFLASPNFILQRVLQAGSIEVCFTEAQKGVVSY